jgi:hypothetical protein
MRTGENGVGQLVRRKEDWRVLSGRGGSHGVIDFGRNYRQYFSPPRHGTIYGLSEAVEARRVGAARRLKGKLVF